MARPSRVAHATDSNSVCIYRVITSYFGKVDILMYICLRYNTMCVSTCQVIVALFRKMSSLVLTLILVVTFGWFKIMMINFVSVRVGVFVNWQYVCSLEKKDGPRNLFNDQKLSHRLQ